MKLFKRLFVILFALSAASCAKISYNPTEVSGISLNRSEITMEVSNTFQLEAYNEPSKVSNKNVSWTVSSGSTIVSVSSTGLIRALKTGSAKVTATEKEKGYTATCNITVSKQMIPVTSVSLSESSATIKQGRATTLSATISPVNASNKTVNWTSSNTNVATVSNGTITGVSAGSATITATTADGGYTSSCVVTVEEKSTEIEDEWTVLIYMCGSTLETESANKYVQGMPYSRCGLATCDIREIIDVPNKPDDVNIVIETGGAQT